MLIFLRASQNVLIEAINVLDRVGRWSRYGAALCLNLGGRLFALLAPPAAVFCFWVALMLVHHNGLSRLSGRYCDVFGNNTLIHLVNLAFWPAHYAWMIADPAPGLDTHQTHALTFIGIGVSLLVAVNLLNLRRQTLENPTGKIAVALWAVAVTLMLGDFARCVLLPVSWDTTPLIGGFTNGMVLRGAEILTAAYLWSLHLVTTRSRADIGITRTWATVSTETRRAFAIHGALLFAFGPAVLGFVERIATGSGKPELFHIIFAVLIAAYASLFLVKPLFDALRLLLSFGLSLISDGDLLVERVAPPERPNRW